MIVYAGPDEVVPNLPANRRKRVHALPHEIDSARRFYGLPPRGKGGRTALGAAMTVNYRNLLARAARLLRSGDSGAADAICRHVLTVDPGNAMGLYVAGLVAHERGDHARSLDLMDQALAAQPEFADALCGRGLARRHLGQRDAAVADFQRALALNPDQAQAHLYLGLAFLEQNILPAAAEEFERALASEPTMATALANLGLVRHRQGRLEDAVSCYRRVLELQPSLIANQNNLAAMLQEVGRASEALDILRHVDAEAMNPTFGANVLTCMNLVPGTPDEFCEAAKHWAGRFADRLAAPCPRPAADPARRLRIGYVAANGLRRHTLAMTYLPLFEAHDPAEVEVFAYSDLSDAEEDDVTQRAKAAVSAWRRTSALDDAALADQIRRDEIDILVDGIGFAAGSRLLAAARRPAPIQVHFPAMSTTGMAAFDYVIGDDTLMPPGSDSALTEQICRLPCGFLYRPVDALPPLAQPPCGHNGFVTFGSFNRVAKIGGDAIALWSAVLRATPSSRLLIKSPTPLARETLAYYTKAFADHGVAPDRVAIGQLLRPFQEFDEIDVALDTVPFGGVLTTCASLAMGVPVVTWAGARVLDRYGAAILTAVEFPQGIASNFDDYVARATELAGHSARLTILRQTLRERLLNSRLCDNQAFARTIEKAYRAMWRRWCADAVHGRNDAVSARLS